MVQVSDASLKTNIVAAYTAGNHAADVRDVAKSLKISPNDGFEVAFNLACSTLQCGLIKEAQECLLLALRLGWESSLSFFDNAQLILTLHGAHDPASY